MFDRNVALILIDMQQGFADRSWGERFGGDVERNLLKLLAAWRENNRPIFHIQHNSMEPNSVLKAGRDGYAFIAGFEPQADETHIVKRVNSGFIGTDLEAQLKANKISVVIIGGLTTNHCVSTTTRMASNLGFETYLVRGGVAAFEGELDGERISAELIHKIALANLNGEFATLLNTNDILAAL